ncbi:MAG TPA: TRAP transporter large permease [Trueperaceae bacterium]|nr:TRAP transporter large permease [Trueperaceae bacterium]
MSGVTVALLALLVMMILLAIRVPIGVSMLTVGLGGYIFLAGWSPAINGLKSLAYDQYSSYTFSIVPLFLLMGEFATRAGLSQALFRSANTWLGHRRGGIAMATIGGSAGFGAIAGSSLATAATMAQVALPEMRKYGYSGALATGSVAAGGTLGILIPPSIVLVLYAILTEQNIAKLFAAAFIPGFLAAFGYMIAIYIYARLRPGESQPGERVGYRERFIELWRVWPVLVIFLLVIGGIYAGFFTPTEAAAVGAVSTLLVALAKRTMTWRVLRQSLVNTAATTGMIFLIVLGAELINIFLALSRLPQTAAARIGDWQVAPIVILIAILLLYFLLGTVMDSLSMILLTTPIFFPIIMGMDFGMPPEELAIWFGILTLVTVEVGLITPPVGLNVYIINSLAPDVPMIETFRGVVPFLISDLIRVALLVAFPAITLAALWWFF